MFGSPAHSFSVFDAHSGDDNRNYSYVFSVCKNVPHPPAACSHKSAAAAYQVANFDIATSSKCHPLSDALPSKSFSLYGAPHVTGCPASHRHRLTAARRAQMLPTLLRAWC